jgi:hypothetical protein
LQAANRQRLRNLVLLPQDEGHYDKRRNERHAFHHAARAQDQARHFCPRCGSTLYWTISSLPDLIGVAGGCFADESLSEPTHSITHRKKESWLALPQTWKVIEE